MGVNLKILVAQAEQSRRQLVLETAYVLEEMLVATEQGVRVLGDRQVLVKQKIVNRVLQERRDREQEALRVKNMATHKLQQRKDQLRVQLDKMKDEKALVASEAEQRSKKKREEELAAGKKKEQAKKAWLQEMTAEGE